MKFKRVGKTILISETERFEFAIRIRQSMRGAGGYYWTATWFPCWLLTCPWSCWTSGTRKPNEPERVPLREIFREMNKAENAHFLPAGARRLVHCLANREKTLVQ